MKVWQKGVLFGLLGVLIISGVCWGKIYFRMRYMWAELYETAEYEAAQKELVTAKLGEAGKLLEKAVEPGLDVAEKNKNVATAARLLKEAIATDNDSKTSVTGTIDIVAYPLSKALYHSTIWVALIFPLPIIWMAFCIGDLHRRVRELEKK